MLMVIAPVRGALAIQDSHCDMEEMVMSKHDGMMGSHDMMTHDMSGMMSSEQPQHNSKQCCCCDGTDCAGQCDMGMSVSIVVQQSSYVPVFKDVSESITVSENILVRELTPPSRPPANLHN